MRKRKRDRKRKSKGDADSKKHSGTVRDELPAGGQMSTRKDRRLRVRKSRQWKSGTREEFVC